MTTQVEELNATIVSLQSQVSSLQDQLQLALSEKKAIEDDNAAMVAALAKQNVRWDDEDFIYVKIDEDKPSILD
jgi:prefoldin subunit 5